MFENFSQPPKCKDKRMWINRENVMMKASEINEKFLWKREWDAIKPISFNLSDRKFKKCFTVISKNALTRGKKMFLLFLLSDKLYFLHTTYSPQWNYVWNKIGIDGARWFFSTNGLIKIWYCLESFFSVLLVSFRLSSKLPAILCFQTFLSVYPWHIYW